MLRIVSSLFDTSVSMKLYQKRQKDQRNGVICANRKRNLRPTTRRLRLLWLLTGELAMYVYVFADFNKTTRTPEVVIRPCFSKAIPHTQLFCSSSFVFEERNVSQLQT